MPFFIIVSEPSGGANFELVVPLAVAAATPKPVFVWPNREVPLVAIEYSNIPR